MLLTLGDVEVSEATRKFVADVASVEFSDPELVWIKKVNTETTVGELKQANKIVCQYSAELTKEQINEINAQSMRAGDWALISMFPFTSEETLTITMKDGKQYVVKVTDAQISTNVLTADGMTFCITVTYDDSAEIPVGTRLVAEEIDQKSVEFIQRVSETLAEVNKGYFKEQELLKKGEDPDTIEHVQPVSMDQARFFHVSLMYEGKEIVPLQFLKAVLPDPASLGPRTVGKTNIGCIFQGKKDGKDKTYYLYNICDHQECYTEVGSQAISYTTGVPAMIGAMLIMTGKWNGAGVFNIEEFDPDPFMEELKKLGIDPEHADEALVQYETEISAMLEEMKGLVPPELMASLQA
jgi:hypothetical protein